MNFVKLLLKVGLIFRLMCQPPNSSDLNILDLGFFASIQALQHKETTKTVDDLIGAVTRSFETFSSIQSNKIFSLEYVLLLAAFFIRLLFV